jgi:hypothetical protein
VQVWRSMRLRQPRDAGPREINCRKGGLAMATSSISRQTIDPNVTATLYLPAKRTFDATAMSLETMRWVEFIRLVSYADSA